MKIEIRNLTKRYTKDIYGIRDVSLTIEGGMFGLLGPNGAGKTTLMRILATLLNPTSGKGCIDGLDTAKDKDKIRSILGYLPQEFGFYPNLTAYETLDYLSLMTGMKDRREQIFETLKKVGLFEVRDRFVKTFSGGMKQRLGIAQAILHSPRLLIVDEPTAGLDPEERVRFRNFLSTFSMDTERLIIFSTHIVQDIEAICPNIAILHHGRLLFIGKTEEFLNAVKDKVWKMTIPINKLIDLEKDFPIISSLRREDNIEVKFLSKEPPDGAINAACNLEDAYIARLSEYGD